MGLLVSRLSYLKQLGLLIRYCIVVYHIHTLPVPADGNCTATMGHLDPTDRGELHACEVAAPQTCQAGDLAGKHGNITTTTFSARYASAHCILVFTLQPY